MKVSFGLVRQRMNRRGAKVVPKLSVSISEEFALMQVQAGRKKSLPLAFG